MTTITLRDFVEGLMAELDGKLAATDEAYMAGCVLFSALAVPADERLIAVELGFDSEFVDVVANRLRNAGLWAGDMLAPNARQRWEEEERGGVAMLCDLNVARGDFAIVGYVDGEPQYSLTPAGNSRVERMLSA